MPNPPTHTFFHPEWTLEPGYWLLYFPHVGVAAQPIAGCGSTPVARAPGFHVVHVSPHATSNHPCLTFTNDRYLYRPLVLHNQGALFVRHLTPLFPSLAQQGDPHGTSNPQ